MKTPRLCTFTKADSTPCRDLAAGRSPLCRNHQRQAARDHRRTLALNSGRTVRLGPLDTMPAIRRALNRIIQLTAAGTLPVERAGHALYRINQAIAAIRRRDAIEKRQATIADVPLPPPAIFLGGLDLLSLIQPPTIEGTTPSGALNLQSQPNTSIKPSTTTRIPRTAARNEQRRTDNATP